MENVRALLVPNTVAASVNGATPDSFMSGQDKMANPIVVFTNATFQTVYESFKIVAESMKDLNLMYEEKVFFTSSVPEGETRRAYGALFVGFPEDYYQTKEKDVLLQQNAQVV